MTDRQAALIAAATFLGNYGNSKPEDVPKLAEAWVPCLTPKRTVPDKCPSPPCLWPDCECGK